MAVNLNVRNSSKRVVKSERKPGSGNNIPSMQAESFKTRHRDWQLGENNRLVLRISQLKDVEDISISLRIHEYIYKKYI